MSNSTIYTRITMINETAPATKAARPKDSISSDSEFIRKMEVNKTAIPPDTTSVPCS